MLVSVQKLFHLALVLDAVFLPSGLNQGYRIQVYIGKDIAKVRVATDVTAFEATLKNDPAVLVLEVECHRISCPQFLHERRYAIIGLLSQYQVVVVRHQRVRKDINERFLDFLFEEHFPKG